MGLTCDFCNAFEINYGRAYASGLHLNSSHSRRRPRLENLCAFQMGQINAPMQTFSHARENTVDGARYMWRSKHKDPNIFSFQCVIYKYCTISMKFVHASTMYT